MTTENTKAETTFAPQHYVTFDPDNPVNKVAMFNAKNTAISLKNIEDSINVVDVIAEPGLRARSGNPCQNTYLIADDGSVYFSQSNGVAKTINELVKMLDGDFSNATDGYATVKLVESALDSDRTYKQLRLLAV